MHDYTRKEMVKLLEDMLKSLDSIIEAANKNTRNFKIEDIIKKNFS